jgi:hypothetical protein
LTARKLERTNDGNIDDVPEIDMVGGSVLMNDG